MVELYRGFAAYENQLVSISNQQLSRHSPIKNLEFCFLQLYDGFFDIIKFKCSEVVFGAAIVWYS